MIQKHLFERILPTLILELILNHFRLTKLPEHEQQDKTFIIKYLTWNLHHKAWINHILQDYITYASSIHHLTSTLARINNYNQHGTSRTPIGHHVQQLDQHIIKII